MRQTRSKTRMERARLEERSLEQLREEASGYRLTLSDRRDVLIDTIMTHIERHGRQQGYEQRDDIF